MSEASESSDDGFVRSQYVSNYGTPFGDRFFDLTIKALTLNGNWNDFKSLYIASRKTVDLLNVTAGTFFAGLQEIQWHDILLHIGRLAEDKRAKLTLNNVVKLLPGEKPFRSDIIAASNQFQSDAAFVKKLRHTRLAHYEMPQLGGKHTTEVVPANEETVQAAIDQLNKTMNLVEVHYGFPQVGYSHFIAEPLGVESVVYFLHLGREEHRRRHGIYGV